MDITRFARLRSLSKPEVKKKFGRQRETNFGSQGWVEMSENWKLKIGGEAEPQARQADWLELVGENLSNLWDIMVGGRLRGG